MPYAKNGDVHIYYEVEGKGPPLIMLHGAFADSELWKEYGYVDALRNDYQIILRDDRAHGKSNREYNPEENYLENNVKDIIAVMDKLGIESAHLVGFSGGGQMALALASLFPQRVKSLIVFAMSPKFQGSDAEKAILQLTQAGADVLIAFMENSMRGEPLTEAAKVRIRATDFKALSFAMSRSYQTDIAGALSQMTMPILVLVGENDNFFSHEKLREEYSQVSDLTFISLPSVGHSIERGDLILPHIKEFLSRVSV